MATYERSGISIITAVEELAAGRYRGFLIIDTEAGEWRFHCSKARSSPLEARADADADVEFAFRRYLTDALGHPDTGSIH